MDAPCPGQHPSDHQRLPGPQAQGDRGGDVREGDELPRQGGLQSRAGARHCRHQYPLLLHQGPAGGAAGEAAQVSLGAGAGGREAQGGQPQEEDGHQTAVIIIGCRRGEDGAPAGPGSEAGLVAASQHRLQRVGDRGGRRGGR